MKNPKIYLAPIVITLLLNSICCNTGTPEQPKGEPAVNTEIPALGFSILNIYPHDTSSFTEGFFVHNHQIFESTGHTDEYNDSRSLFGIVNLATGKIDPKVELDKRKFFGEGIALLKGKIYQLTYTERIGFVYDTSTFRKLGEFTIPTKEGWGLTTDGTYLIMTDGSSNLTYLDPTNFRVAKIVGVSDINGYVSNLNELEYIHGSIYANQYQTNNILKIDPESGKVVGKANFDAIKREVLNKYPGSIDMNGIAYDSVDNKVYITGKRWPSIYQIRFQ